MRVELEITDVAVRSDFGTRASRTKHETGIRPKIQFTVIALRPSGYAVNVEHRHMITPCRGDHVAITVLPIAHIYPNSALPAAVGREEVTQVATVLEDVEVILKCVAADVHDVRVALHVTRPLGHHPERDRAGGA